MSLFPSLTPDDWEWLAEDKDLEEPFCYPETTVIATPFPAESLESPQG